MPLPVTSITTLDTEAVLTIALALVGVSTGSISVQWSVLAGPGGPSAGNATFSTPTLSTTNVTFSKTGVYVLMFKGTNATGFTVAFIVIAAFNLSAPPGPNPVVNTENP